MALWHTEKTSAPTLRLVVCATHRGMIVGVHCNAEERVAVTVGLSGKFKSPVTHYLSKCFALATTDAVPFVLV